MLFAMTVDAYGMLPQWAVILVARTLPWAELLLGLLLIAGKWMRFRRPPSRRCCRFSRDHGVHLPQGHADRLRLLRLRGPHLAANPGPRRRAARGLTGPDDYELSPPVCRVSATPPGNDRVAGDH